MAEYNLTDTEKKICEKITEGKSNKEIAQELYMSELTVKTHIQNILKKRIKKCRHRMNDFENSLPANKRSK